jgi:hypothetical protein
MRFFKNFKADSVVTVHMWDGCSPRCIGSDPQPATEDDLAELLEDGGRRSGAGRVVIET